MVKTIIVPKEDMEVVRKYLRFKYDSGCTADAVVLIDENILSSLPEEQASCIKKIDGMYANYKFYGEADMWVDIVDSTDHIFLDWLGGN